ncbi:MAG: GNAT family N-acetyltransferase [Eubacteriales bacterium]|nr:GNAT family N-acetyltransferase [Eubacteriales bacterium]
MKTDFTDKILPMCMEDLDELVRLHDIYLNYGEGIRPHFEKALQDPASVALKCVIDGRIAGIAVYIKGVFLSGGHADICQRIQLAAGDALIYTGDALLVLPEYRRQGMDEAMVDIAKERIRALGGSYALHELWVHPDGRTPARRTPGFYDSCIDMGEFKNFYYDFDHFGYYCPICKGKCVCSAHIYLCYLGKDEHDENTQA